MPGVGGNTQVPAPGLGANGSIGVRSTQSRSAGPDGHRNNRVQAMQHLTSERNDEPDRDKNAEPHEPPFFGLFDVDEDVPLPRHARTAVPEAD